MENQCYASFFKRFLAVLLDMMITCIPFGIIVVIFELIMFATGIDKELVKVLGYLPGLFLNWLYYGIMESSPMQGTLGKMICKIRVTDLNGERISLVKATGRFFGKYLSGFLLGVGYIMAAFTERRQALHDKMAGTLVLEGRPASVGVADADPIDI